MAAEQLLDKGDSEIKKIGEGIIQAHTKMVIRAMKKNELETDREKLAVMVGSLSSKDLRNMGLEIRSFVIKEVK